MVYRVKGDTIEIKDSKTGKFQLTMSLKRGLQWYDVNEDIHIMKIKDKYGCIMLDTRYHDFIIGNDVPTLYDWERG